MFFKQFFFPTPTGIAGVRSSYNFEKCFVKIMFVTIRPCMEGFQLLHRKRGVTLELENIANLRARARMLRSRSLRNFSHLFAIYSSSIFLIVLCPCSCVRAQFATPEKPTKHQGIVCPALSSSRPTTPIQRRHKVSEGGHRSLHT